MGKILEETRQLLEDQSQVPSYESAILRLNDAVKNIQEIMAHIDVVKDDLLEITSKTIDVSKIEKDINAVQDVSAEMHNRLVKIANALKDGLNVAKKQKAPKEGAAKYSFKYVTFRDGGFQKLLSTFGVKPEAKVSDGFYVWKGPGLIIKTMVNPITGVRIDPSQSGRIEKNYASWTFLEGEKDKVYEAAALIKKYASDIKSEYPGQHN